MASKTTIFYTNFDLDKHFPLKAAAHWKIQIDSEETTTPGTTKLTITAYTCSVKKDSQGNWEAEEGVGGLSGFLGVYNNTNQVISFYSNTYRKFNEEPLTATNNTGSTSVTYLLKHNSDGSTSEKFFIKGRIYKGSGETPVGDGLTIDLSKCVDSNPPFTKCKWGAKGKVYITKDGSERKDFLLPGEYAIQWSGAEEGTKNSIAGYQVGYTLGSTKIVSEQLGATTNSWTFRLSETDRGKEFVPFVKIIPTLANQVDNATKYGASARVNRRPEKPFISPSSGIVEKGTTKVKFELTRGADADNQQLALYYREEGTNVWNEIESSSGSFFVELDVEETIKNYCFYTHDGWEYSEPLIVPVGQLGETQANIAVIQSDINPYELKIEASLINIQAEECSLSFIVKRGVTFYILQKLTNIKIENYQTRQEMSISDIRLLFPSLDFMLGPKFTFLVRFSVNGRDFEREQPMGFNNIAPTLNFLKQQNDVSYFDSELGINMTNAGFDYIEIYDTDTFLGKAYWNASKQCFFWTLQNNNSTLKNYNFFCRCGFTKSGYLSKKNSLGKATQIISTQLYNFTSSATEFSPYPSHNYWLENTHETYKLSLYTNISKDGLEKYGFFTNKEGAKIQIQIYTENSLIGTINNTINLTKVNGQIDLELTQTEIYDAIKSQISHLQESTHDVRLVFSIKNEFNQERAVSLLGSPKLSLIQDGWADDDGALTFTGRNGENDKSDFPSNWGNYLLPNMKISFQTSIYSYSSMPRCRIYLTSKNSDQEVLSGPWHWLTGYQEESYGLKKYQLETNFDINLISKTELVNLYLDITTNTQTTKIKLNTDDFKVISHTYPVIRLSKMSLSKENLLNGQLDILYKGYEDIDSSDSGFINGSVSNFIIKERDNEYSIIEGELSNPQEFSVSIETSLNRLEIIPSVQSILTLTVNNNEHKSLTVNNELLYALQAIKPTIAYRQNSLGINTQDIGEDVILIIQNYEGRNKVVFSYMDDNNNQTTYEIDVSTGAIDGFTISGGEW